MELEGRIFSILELAKGTSAKGEWKKQSFVVEVASDFPKKVCVTVWGAKVEALTSLNTGDKVSMTIDIESREFNGRWYTDVVARRLDKVGGSTVAPAPAFSNDAPPMPGNDSFDAIFSSEDDLVF